MSAMADDVLALAERLWQGEQPAEIHHLFTGAPALVEVDEGAAFVAAFANACVFRTDAGLVMVDTGSFLTAGALHGEVRRWTRDPAQHRRLLARSRGPRLRGPPVRGRGDFERMGAASCHRP